MTMEPIPYPGCYQCPRCYNRDVYDSEKTIGAYAVTYDVKGPVNPTFVNADTIPVKRCRKCNEVADYIEHPKYKKEMQERRLKRLKQVLTVVAGIVGIVLSVSFINKVKNDLATNARESNFAAEVKKWNDAALKCGIPEREVSDYPNGDPTSDGVPKIDVGLFIEPASNLGNFWISSEGKSVDCFSNEVMGIQVSKYLTYKDSEISRLKNFDGPRLYDETFVDGLEPGVLGKATNYQGYLSFNEKDDYHKDSYFFLHLEWQLEPIR